MRSIEIEYMQSKTKSCAKSEMKIILTLTLSLTLTLTLTLIRTLSRIRSRGWRQMKTSCKLCSIPLTTACMRAPFGPRWWFTALYTQIIIETPKYSTSCKLWSIPTNLTRTSIRTLFRFPLIPERNSAMEICPRDEVRGFSFYNRMRSEFSLYCLYFILKVSDFALVAVTVAV